jgi:hypothetical protein
MQKKFCAILVEKTEIEARRKEILSGRVDSNRETDKWRLSDYLIRTGDLACKLVNFHRLMSMLQVSEAYLEYIEQDAIDAI